MVAHNRLGHALLLVGKEGSGVLPLAINFGQYVVSYNAQAEAPPKAAPVVADLFGGVTTLPQEEDVAPVAIAWPDPQALQAAHQLMHPDLHLSYPVFPKKSGDKPVSTDFIGEFRNFYRTYPYGNVYDWLQSVKAENRQGNITAEECNDIIRKLSLHAFQSRYKVLVMWMPEYLGKEGNKLLKLIEEPPPDTLFILAAENEEHVLPTIISRCQVLRVPPLEDADIEEALIYRCRMEPAQAKQIAVVVDGNYHEALLMYQHHERDWNTLIKEFLNASLSRGASEATRYKNTLKVVSDLAELGRERQKQLLRYFLQLIEISIRLKIIGQHKLTLPPAEAEFAARLLKVAGLSQLKAIAAELENDVYYIERNANAKILFHALAIKLRGIVMEKTVLLTS